MVIDPEGTPEQKKARGTHWIGKTFEEVVEAELKELERYDITEETSYEEFRDRYLATRPQGYGSHSLLARGLYALQVRKETLAAFSTLSFLLIMPSPLLLCTHS